MSTRIDQLAPELLSLIFSFIPYYSRVRVISVVSKRWRSAFFDSITDGDVLYSRNLSKVLHRLTQVKFITIDPFVRPVVPRSVQSLCFTSNCYLSGRALLHCCEAAQAASSLTALRVLCSNSKECADLNAFISSTKSSLRSLSLKGVCEQPALGSLLGLRYDHITELNMVGHCLWNANLYSALISCLAIHAPQLEMLSLAFSALGENQSVIAALSTPMPRLTNLGLASNCITNYSAVASIFACHPKLNVVSLGLGGDDVAGLCRIISHARPILTSLKLFQFPSGHMMELQEEISACPRLTRLKALTTVTVTNTPQLRRIMPYPPVADLVRFSSLQKYSATLADEDVVSMESVPPMRFLTWTELTLGQDCDIPLSFAFLTRFIEAAPALRTLTATVKAHMYSTDVVENFLAEVIARGQLQGLTLRLHKGWTMAEFRELRNRRYPWLNLSISISGMRECSRWD